MSPVHQLIECQVQRGRDASSTENTWHGVTRLPAGDLPDVYIKPLGELAKRQTAQATSFLEREARDGGDGVVAHVGSSMTPRSAAVKFVPSLSPVVGSPDICDHALMADFNFGERCPPVRS